MDGRIDKDGKKGQTDLSLMISSIMNSTEQKSEENHTQTNKRKL
jgi:hypothetical protein